MSGAWLAAQHRPTLSARLYARLPIPPIWIGALIALCYLLGVLAFFAIIGAPTG